MGHTVHQRDRERVTRAGFARVAGVPFIVDPHQRYHRWGSRYLIDRAVGEWNSRSGKERATHAGAVTFLPSTVSTLDYAKCLVNFLDWAEARTVDTLSCTYAAHILGAGGYQPDMLAGRWSVTGRGLAEATVNARVQVAGDYLAWLSAKGVRKQPFNVPTKAVRVQGSVASGSRSERVVHRRVGSLRVPKSQLFLPDDEQLKCWLASVRVKSGPTFHLMAETVLKTALRESELTSLRVDALPESPRDWRISNKSAPRKLQMVLISFTHGAKGYEFSRENGDKVGPRRDIHVPLELAEKWHAYRNGPRLKALEALADSAPTHKARAELLAGAVHLFLHPGNKRVHAGARISQDQLYRAWKNSALPFKEWTVHLGRDWWACTKLLEEVKKDELIQKLGLAVPAHLLQDKATTVIQFVIRPQLGHKSPTSTVIYLQWLFHQFDVPLPVMWQEKLDEVSEEEL